jgi:hypothetical protein
MTFAFHHYSGMMLGILIARLLGWDPWIWGGFGFIVGGWSDSASWVVWKLSQCKWWRWKKWTRWEMYGLCHPPYDATSGHGSWDKIFKWVPMWGQHTWLWDSIVHPSAPRWLFPKFPSEWANVIWIRIWPSHWNIEWTKWDVLYVLLEATLWFAYSLIWLI